MNLSPKKAFLESAQAKPFYDMAISPALHAALQAALSEMQLSSKRADPAANWQRLEGAKNFIEIFLNLAEPPARRKPGVPHDNLNPVN